MTFSHKKAISIFIHNIGIMIYRQTIFSALIEGARLVHLLLQQEDIHDGPSLFWIHKELDLLLQPDERDDASNGVMMIMMTMMM